MEILNVPLEEKEGAFKSSERTEEYVQTRVCNVHDKTFEGMAWESQYRRPVVLRSVKQPQQTVLEPMMRIMNAAVTSQIADAKLPPWPGPSLLLT